MCLRITKNAQVKVSRKDKTVYVLRIMSNRKNATIIRSPYHQNTTWKVGSVKTIKDKDINVNEGSGVHDYVRGGAFHSVASLNVVKKWVKDEGKWRVNNAIYKYMVYEARIPKGTAYYKGTWTLYLWCSDAHIITCVGYASTKLQLVRKIR